MTPDENAAEMVYSAQEWLDHYSTLRKGRKQHKRRDTVAVPGSSLLPTPPQLAMLKALREENAKRAAAARRSPRQGER